MTIHLWLVCFLFAQIEELGSEGRVEEAQGMMKLVEQLKEERELLNSTPSVSGRVICVHTLLRIVDVINITILSVSI